MQLHDAQRLATLRAYEPAEMERDQSLDSLCDLVRLTLGVPMAAVSLVDDQITHHVGMSGVEFGPIPSEHTFCSHTIEGQEPLLVEDATKDPRFAENPFVRDDPSIRFYVGAPLIAPNGYRLGALCAVDTATRRCTEVEQTKLAALASTAVQILEMRRRVREAHALAVTDGLTGIANRVGTQLAIDKAITVMKRHGLLFSLLYFDVDHFKSINDTRGHEAGDQLLRLIGSTLSQRTRFEEVVGRLGGDEFVIVLIGSDRSAAALAAERIKSLLDETVQQASIAVSFSMGLACFTEAPADSAAALSAADTLLYQAKRGGKNRIVCSQIGAAGG